MTSRLHITRRGTLAVLAILLAGAAGWGYHARQGQGARAVAAESAAKPTRTAEFMPEDLYTVRKDALVRSLPLTGTLAALTSATVKAKVAGELVEVTAREGQAVKRGQILARIDPTEVQARVAARQADAEAARAQLALAEKNRATQKSLLEKSFISQNAFDTTLSGQEVATARLRAAEADLVSARKSLGDAVLLAPFSGIVSERHAQPGERVPLDGKVISLVDLARLELEANVPASTISRVRIGQPVSFRVDGFGERGFEGRIERINPATTAGSRSISIYAVIDNADGSLRGGLFAQGELILERITDALLAPASAVREETGGQFVYAIVDGTLRRKPVKTGRADASGQLQILEGLSVGDRIVRSNLGALREGAPATVRERTPAAAPAGNTAKPG
jgi:membrane fusion protein (multidrug efflux system)